MALNAMNEALLIARQFAMDYFICPAMDYDPANKARSPYAPTSKEAKFAAISIFLPLFNLVDIQMERPQNKMPAALATLTFRTCLCFAKIPKRVCRIP